MIATWKYAAIAIVGVAIVQVHLSNRYKRASKRRWALEKEYMDKQPPYPPAEDL